MIDHAGDDLPQGQFPFAGRAQRFFYAQASGDVVHSPHGPKREPLLQRDRILEGPQMLQLPLVAQCQPQRCNLRLGTMTDIRNGAMEYFAVGAIRLAQQMPRIRFATTGDVRGIDIHSGYNYNTFIEYK